MPNPEAVFYEYTEEYKDAFRRLGGAVVYRWDYLPPDVQTLLLDQATLVGNEDHPGTTREQILAFIEAKKRRAHMPPET